MKMIFSLALLLAFQGAFAETLTGSFTATEVEPIMNYEYVSSTCTRYDRSCQTMCDASGNNCGEQCTDSPVAYECGRDEWVRRGSKPLFDLEVEYTADLLLVSPNLKPGIKILSQTIDTGYSKDTFLRAFIGSSVPNIGFSASELKIDEQLIGVNKKKLLISFKASFIDPKAINGIIEKKTTFKGRSHLELSAELPLAFMDLTVCVGQDRLLSRNQRSLGCQSVKQNSVDLEQSIFANARTKRDLYYTFSWQLKGVAISYPYEAAPTIQRGFFE